MSFVPRPFSSAGPRDRHSVDARDPTLLQLSADPKTKTKAFEPSNESF